MDSGIQHLNAPPNLRPMRLQEEENWASRPLCYKQASDRQISSWVGDDQRIPAVACI